MIGASKGRGHDTIHGTVVIAFDRSSGQVHGTYVHGSLGGPDAAGLARNRERLLTDITARLGEKCAGLDTLEIPLHELPSDPIDRVDIETRRLMTKPIIRQPPSTL